MRWTATFIYLSVVVITLLLLSVWLGWSAWLLAIAIVLLMPLAFWLGFAHRHSVRWSTVLSYLSAASLLGALVSQIEGWTGAKSWFWMMWAVFQLAVIISPIWHPMRRPGLGLFVGFWGLVGGLWLIVLQLFNLADVLKGGAYLAWIAWPVALIGIWFVVASANGFGAEPFGRIVDLLGILAGGSFIAISIGIWIGASDLSPLGLVAVFWYFIWVAGLGWALLRVDQPAQHIQTVRSSSPV